MHWLGVSNDDHLVDCCRAGLQKLMVTDQFGLWHLILSSLAHS